MYSEIIFKSYTPVTEALPAVGDFVMTQVEFDRRTSFVLCKFGNDNRFLWGKKLEQLKEGNIVAWKKIQ